MVRSFLLSEIASSVEGVLRGDDLSVSSVSIDSRTISEQGLFVAIRGENFDGHNFIDAALKNGCDATIVENSSVSDVDSGSAIQVKDTRLALAQVGALNRNNFEGKVVGITGSSGKTTAKNLLASILSQDGNTLSTKGNFNNEIGVPLTLLNIEEQHKYAVVEMGARNIGDIGYLGQFVKPDVAILLNVGNAHIDVFGSYENILKTKSEIFEDLQDDGVVVFHADAKEADYWTKLTKHKRAVRFSTEPGVAEVWSEMIEYQQDYSRFKLCVDGGSIGVTLPMPGHHNVLNALAVAAAAIGLGLSLEQIKNGLESAANDDGRLHVVDLPNGTRVIDDSYNANPASMKAAIDVLSLYEGKKIAVLGEMAELGDFSEKLHRQVAKHGKSKVIDRFLLIGPFADVMAEEIGEGALVFDNKKSLFEQLEKMITGDETILVKGSRCAAMDEVVDRLRGEVS